MSTETLAPKSEPAQPAPAPAAPAPAAPVTPPKAEAPAPAPAKSLLTSLSDEAPKEPAPQKEAAADLKAPEGMPQEVFDAYTKEVKAAGITGAAAQKLLDTLVTSHSSSLRARIEQASQEWATASKADPEFGGQKWNESAPVIARGARALGVSDTLRTILDQTGLANHPEMLRVFYRAGRLLSSDKVVGATPPGAPPAAAHPATVLYDKTN